MTLAFDLGDLPGDAIGLLLLLLISFLGWLKNRFNKAEEETEFLDEDEERMREIVWRRQMGEQEERSPWQSDPVVRQAPTPPPMPQTEPPPVPAFKKPEIHELSEKERLLAEAFEHRAGRRRRRQARTPLGRALHSPGATRQAILLAEVLGPPVALREPGERHP